MTWIVTGAKANRRMRRLWRAKRMSAIRCPPDGLKIQISFSYSDGFGREIQKKIQAEPGRLDPTIRTRPSSTRAGWAAAGRSSTTRASPFASTSRSSTTPTISSSASSVGVSPVLFYDPVERVVATLHPNHTWEKVVFDPWRQTTYDVNDTVLNDDGSTDPKSDEDVKGFFSRLPDADYLPTWYEQRIALAANDPERIAADKAAVHRQTPTVAHLDTLGRTFLTIAHNRFERNGAIVEEKYPTRVELDIEGNQRAVRDAIVQNSDTLGRIVMRYDYDMLGNRIHQASMEAGERWMLNDVTGKPIRAWDSRGFIRRITYDELRRPTGLFVTENGVERLAERTVYGESQGEANNHRTRVFQVFDGAGVGHQRGLRLQGQSAAQQARPVARLQRRGGLAAESRAQRRNLHQQHDLRCAQSSDGRHRAGQQRLSPDLQRSQSARQGGGEPARRGDGHAVRHQHRLQRQGTAHPDPLRQWRRDDVRVRRSRPSA